MSISFWVEGSSRDRSLPHDLQAAQAVQLEAEGVFLFTDVDYLYTVGCLMVGLST